MHEAWCADWCEARGRRDSMELDALELARTWVLAWLQGQMIAAAMADWRAGAGLREEGRLVQGMVV